jgi:hypothetical protein
VNTLMLHLFVFTGAGWISSGQQGVIDYLREENRVLREITDRTATQRRESRLPTRSAGTSSRWTAAQPEPWSRSRS